MGITSRSQFLQQALFGAVALRGYHHEQYTASLDEASISKLASQIAGRVITPESPDYESSRQVFNRAFDLRPALIARCAASSDVARALDFTQRRNLPLAVHGGGHSRLGYGMCDGGVVIDLSAMNNVAVDARKLVARVDAGALVSDLDAATQRFGLATTSGGCPTVGVAGLTLGGGEGRLMEKFGTACDNLLSARVVTVDGREVEAGPEFNADLFWAIRGGGGNFGVVTMLEYKLHPLAEVVSGMLLYPAKSVPEVLQKFADFLATAPDEMDATARFFPSASGLRFRVDVCWCGDSRIANDLLKPLRALEPQSDNVKRMSYLAAQSAGGFLLAPVAHFQTDLVVRNIGDAGEAMARALDHAPATCQVIIVPLRGAVTRVALSDTAFALRKPGFEVDISGTWKVSSEKAGIVGWVDATRESLRPFAHGVYVNQLGDTNDRLVREAYGVNYARLARLKEKYDPNNVLRLNQNIRPN